MNESSISHDSASTDSDVTVAAVDLGSNSFHMMVAAPDGGGLRIIDRLRESVRLADGLTKKKRLSAEARQRALACLERFGQRLQHIPPRRVRVVGTNTLRLARDSGDFQAEAEAALGHSIEVITGYEEARLIYGGATQGLGDEAPRRLVMDIGGGSTEIILGELNRPRYMESLPMGCVMYTQHFFANGRITNKRWKKAVTRASLEVERVKRLYQSTGWDKVIGCSGSIRSVQKVIAEQGWGDVMITRDALAQVEAQVLSRGRIDKLDLPGLREDRQPIFAGSLLVLKALFDGLGLEEIEVSDRALRDGLIYDLLGRLAFTDIREQTVNTLMERFNVPQNHAHRVEQTALSLLEAVSQPWGLEGRQPGLYLAWAARLHELGLSVSHNSYHQHGAYLLRHGDMAGFSQVDQKLLSSLVELQKGKINDNAFNNVPKRWQDSARRLTALLRLSVLLHRSRNPDPIPLRATADNEQVISLQFPQDWLSQHALTQADLESEQRKLKRIGIGLSFG